ncbi:MAG TPA: acyltransferase [Bryobacteraceae bacterium]|nr:acyltransferase [Bryobacteraceae bacterium]
MSGAPARRPASHSSEAQQLPALTGVRFLLALWVVLHHLTGKRMMLEAWAASLPAPVFNLVRGGYLAVGTFFVLSGFVLARSYGPTLWNRRNLLRYGMGRFARVYPAYLVSLLIVIPMAARYLAKPGPSGAEKASTIASYIFVLQGWAAKPPVYWNTPAWSLSCEFFFYLCFPVLALCLRRRSGLTIIGAAAAALMLPTLFGRLGVPLYWKPVTDLADFMLGIGAAGLYDRIWRGRAWMAQRGWLLYVPAAACSLALVAFPWVLDGWTTLSTALRVMNAALVIGLACGGGLPALALSTRIATKLGHASYSLYILHVPLMWWFSRYWWHPVGVKLVVCVAGYLIGVVAVSILAFDYVEAPANRRIRAWMNARVN